jgi:hypothetical protein
MGRKGEPLTVEQILAWADAHKARTGTWPTRRSGPSATAGKLPTGGEAKGEEGTEAERVRPETRKVVADCPGCE